jgi:hypothetical protein
LLATIVRGANLQWTRPDAVSRDLELPPVALNAAPASVA